MIEIKQLTIDDVREHHDTLCQTYDALVPSSGTDVEVLVSQFQKIEKQGTQIYIALDSVAKRIVGVWTLLVEYKLHRGCVSAWHIEDVSVDKDYQDRWVWTKILKRLVEEWEKAWCYKIILDCDPKYVGYYEKFWFEDNWTFMRRYSKND